MTRIGTCGRWALAAVWLLAAGVVSGAADPPGEADVFKAAARLFDDKLYDLAQGRFAEFIARFPASDRRPLALLLEAESFFFLNKLEPAGALLSAELAKSGDLGDRYHYWLGEIALKRGKFEAAIDQYSMVAAQFPKSELRAEAVYKQALAISKSGDWAKVAETLGAEDGPLAQEAAAHPDSEGVHECLLLLAEARLKLEQFARSEKVLFDLEKRKVSAVISWKRDLLRCRLSLAMGDLPSALALTTNLDRVATSHGEQNWHAEALGMRGEILEKMGRNTEAVELYEQNLETLPPPMRRRALLKIVDLAGPTEKSTNAISRLELFIQQDPTNEVVDLARLTLGELRLRGAAADLEGAGGAPSLSVSNGLAGALTNFGLVLESPRRGDLEARAWMERGWCFWFLGQRREAADAFQKALGLLPVSAPRAVAQFKLGDALYSLGEFGGAQTNYRAVLRSYAPVKDLPAGLLDQALYQYLRASLSRNDAEAAQEAVRDLIAHFPGVALSDRSLLLYGKALNRARQPGEARELLTGFLDRFPQSTLRPEAELALAESYMDAGEFAEAYRLNKAWVESHPANALLAQAVFSEALAADKAGLTTNSFALMTNFVARFAADSLAPMALKWVGDYYFDRENYPEAEKHYQMLIAQTNAPKTLLEEAALMAARSASARDGLNEASGYLKQLVATVDTNSPVLFADAWLFLGDTLFQQFLQSSNKLGAELARESIAAFNRVTNALPGTIYEARALGRIGDCQFQWAATLAEDPRKPDPNLFSSALSAYQAAAAAPGADVSIRQQAAVKLGIVFEREKQPALAMRKYTDALYGADPGGMDAYWVSQAGLSAARLCEQAGQPDKAANIYERLAKLLPGMRPMLEKKIAAARSSVAAKR